MFDAWLQPDGLPSLISQQEEVSWESLCHRVQAFTHDHASLQSQRVGLMMSSDIDSVVRFISLVSLGAHVYLMAAEPASSAGDELAGDFRLHSIFASDGSVTHFQATSEPADSLGAVTILTSGTTGKPKAAEHTWATLSRPVRRGVVRPRWLLTYRPHLYAGLQVMLQCLLNRGTLVIPDARDSAEEVATLAARSGVRFASATPSWWRWLLTLAGAEQIAAMSLEQITLGGEAVDQATLDALHKAFPGTRLIHIYATTELGRCFSVTDGQAGFPARFLEQASSDGVEMKIDDGELVVRSANAMTGYDANTISSASQSSGQDVASPKSDWFRTGDLVALKGNRVHFVGRKTDMINVGGNKVYPIEVEKVVRSVDGVADTRVFGEASSIVGELVKCELVLQSGYDANEVIKAVREKCGIELNAYQRPRFIEVVVEIPRTAAGKTVRH